MPESIADIDTPSLLIERSILDENILRMQALADRRDIFLRPHIKTHKIIALAKRQLTAGAVGIAVAKLSEAEVMASAGVTDIQIANQVVGERKLIRMQQLTKDGVTLSCAIDSIWHLRQIEECSRESGIELPVLIEIDTGLHRCGLECDAEILTLAKSIEKSNSVRLLGIMSHAGQAYAATCKEEIRGIGRQAGERMVEIARMLTQGGCNCPVLSVGSTPTAPYVSEVSGITELRVGNYVFNDMMQVLLGVAEIESCALSVSATVISRPASDRAVLDAGSKALGLDRGAHGNDRTGGFGYLPNYDIWINRLSEEHGVLIGNGRLPEMGERVRILPNHACPVVNLFDRAWLIDGGVVIEEWPVDARGCMN